MKRALQLIRSFFRFGLVSIFVSHSSNSTSPLKEPVQLLSRIGYLHKFTHLNSVFNVDFLIRQHCVSGIKMEKSSKNGRPKLKHFERKRNQIEERQKVSNHRKP